MKKSKFTCPKGTIRKGKVCVHKSVPGKSRKMTVKLLDEMGVHKPLDVRVEANLNSIRIYPKGYGDSSSAKGYGSPLLVEIFGGKLRAVAWEDINQEDPTTIIDLEGSKESKRKN